MRPLYISLSLFILFIPRLAYSQSWEISLLQKYSGSANLQNSRYIDYSNTSVNLKKSFLTIGISYESFNFFDEVALAGYNYLPPLINKVPGNRYSLDYLGIETGFSFSFLNYFSIENGFSASLLMNSTINELPFFNLNTGTIHSQNYNLSKTELYFSNTNSNENNWNLVPIVLGLYQKVKGKITIYKNIKLISELEHKYFYSPMIFNENIDSGFFNGQEIGFRSIFLISFGIGYTF